MITLIKSGKLSGNIYVVQNGDLYFLIGTGIRSKRKMIENKLKELQIDEN